MVLEPLLKLPMRKETRAFRCHDRYHVDYPNQCEEAGPFGGDFGDILGGLVKSCGRHLVVARLGCFRLLKCCSVLEVGNSGWWM